jgi:hypothetical protein
MDVEIIHGATYGQAQVRSQDLAPANGAALVHIVAGIDVPRFVADFIALASQ